MLGPCSGRLAKKKKTEAELLELFLTHAGTDAALRGCFPEVHTSAYAKLAAACGAGKSLGSSVGTG